MKTKQHTFLYKTHKMLSDPVASQTVVWNPSGTAFQILNSSDFVQEVLPRYFKHKTLASFLRQLNLYNFRKCRDTQEYSHPLFTKDRPDLLLEIRRKGSEAQAQAKAVQNKLSDLQERHTHAHERIGQLEADVERLALQSRAMLSQSCESQTQVGYFQGLLASLHSRKLLPPHALATLYSNTWPPVQSLRLSLQSDANS